MSVLSTIDADDSANRFLYNTLEQHVFRPALIPLTLQNARAVIFPNNSLGPPAPPPPSKEEQLQIRRQAAKDVLSLVPNLVKKTFLAKNDEEEMEHAVEEDVLDVFGSSYMNKHLIYGILELVIVRLVPELAEKTPGELLAERGIEIGVEES